MSAGDQNYIGKYKNRTDNLIPGTKINVNVFLVPSVLKTASNLSKRLYLLMI